MHRLKQQLSMRRRLVKDLVDNGLNPLPNRLAHWDDQFTAPIWGFKGARDYYEQCSAGPLLKHVALPTILLSANDDPVVPFDSYQRFTLSNSIELIETQRGGHLGFLGRHPRDPDRFWMDWRICNWLASLDEF
jgi:predicted alpha/beta-fold hydrolase